MSKDDLPNIIIVGAGSAGSRAAYQLSKKLDTTKYNLVVINPRPYTILYPATARAVVSDKDNLKEHIFVPIEDILKGKGRLVLGKATKVEPASGKEGGSGGTVTVSNGETISYRALILSPGVSWDNPIGFPDGADGLNAYLASDRESFEKSEKIVLVGAGAVGLELCGEIRDVFPDKQITMVHGDTLPLNSFYPEKYRLAVQRSFEKRNITFLLEEYIDTVPNLGEKITEVKTRSGKAIEADLVLSTRGQRPNSELIAESFGADTLNSRRLVKVEHTLQLKGHQDIFVIGDVIDWNEQKQAFKAQAHADIAVGNLLSLLKGQNKFKKYTGSFEFLFLTNGKNGGVTYINVFGGITLGDWITRMAKSKSLIVPLLRGHVGL
ncbi:hypothetical protein D9756_005947 [Leucocoprinus leucothites]|uniref:FAD/NAD(P)-binding domain-containing protein n=1 Tax=Leucocoprinus leucothites TaxID=201217 RepID=A0A8H5D389_9AGAR|nr:hypothetical protein D9756_005947 [Leucoagaricus leucothites]